MASLKAALFTNGNMAELVRRAIENYKDKLPSVTCMCGSETIVKLEDEEFSFMVADNEHVLKVKNVPVFECPSCKEIYEDVRVVAALEEELDDEIHWRLNNRKELPNELDFFNDLLKLEPDSVVVS